MRRWLAIHSLGYLLASGGAALSAGNPCIAAAELAADRLGVPRKLLETIATAESGRAANGGRLAPWPWAVHAQGRGHWFTTQDDALQFVHSLLQTGERNIDIGCFQLNFHWHHTGFQSLNQMFNPTENALYAASFLRSLWQKSGDWRAAAGAYHSGELDRSASYVARLEDVFRVAAGVPFARRADPPTDPQTEIDQATAPRAIPGMPRPRGPLIATQIRPLIGGTP